MPWWVGLLIGLVGGFVGGVAACYAFLSTLQKREEAANRK